MLLYYLKIIPSIFTSSSLYTYVLDVGPPGLILSFSYLFLMLFELFREFFSKDLLEVIKISDSNTFSTHSFLVI